MVKLMFIGVKRGSRRRTESPLKTDYTHTCPCIWPGNGREGVWPGSDWVVQMGGRVVAGLELATATGTLLVVTAGLGGRGK